MEFINLPNAHHIFVTACINNKDVNRILAEIAGKIDEASKAGEYRVAYLPGNDKDGHLAEGPVRDYLRTKGYNVNIAGFPNEWPRKIVVEWATVAISEMIQKGIWNYPAL